MDDSEITLRTALARLKWPLRLTWAGLLAERLTRAFWPVWTLAFAAIAAIAFNAHMAAPMEAVWIVTVLWVIACLWFLVVGLRVFRWPGRTDALARLDQTLPGRPLAALADRQAIGATDAASAAVWQAHLLRMAERAALARSVRPDLRLNRRDPYALRYVALTAFVLALMFGSLSRMSEVGQIAPSPMRFDAQAGGPSWEAWIQPPAYTGRPSLYLNEVDRPALTMPVGSRVTVRLYGDRGVLTLAETVTGNEAGFEDGQTSFDFEISRSGRIAVQGPAGRGWEITVLPDAPPEVRLRGEVTREAGGTMRQTFEARDDYGVVSGEAEITLDLARVERRHGLAQPPEAREPLVLDLPMPIAGNRAEFTEALIENLSEHPWANLPVTLRLRVSDAQAQTGESAPAQIVLPGRRFFDPTAAGVIEMRRDLLWSRETAPRVAQIIRAITHRPEDGFRNERAYLLLRTALRQLEDGIADGLSVEMRDEIAEALWEIALLIEDGDLADALERLRRAQERLSEAMRNGADPSEIAELMQELRDAMRDYMRQLAEQGGQDDQQFAEGERMEITGDQLQQLLDRIQELMEQGRMAEAMELMEQLNRMMENMQVTRGQGGEGGEGDRAMQGLGDALRDQQDLSDETFDNIQQGDDGDGGQQGQQPGEDGDGNGGQQGQQGQGTPQGPGQGGLRGLADRQQALRDQIDGLAQGDIPGDGTEAGRAAREALDDARRSMDEAAEALRQGDGAGALDRQADAIEAMRDGLRNMGEALAEQQGQRGDDSQATADGGPANNRDPLGRSTGELGRIGTEDNMLQGEDIYRRARDILEEIRRRSGEQDRPELELDYLRRLLDRF